MTWKNTVVLGFDTPNSDKVVETSDSDKKVNSDLEPDVVWDCPEDISQSDDLLYFPVWLNTTPYGQEKNIRRAGGLILAMPKMYSTSGLIIRNDVYRRVGRATLEPRFVLSMMVETTQKKSAFLQAHHHNPHKKKSETIYLV